ncbi:patatin-like phospholipase family protein [Chryseobacterium sp.]|uniref:patatin-like phospholipase family protein n=1 Tax=Chryseobacterium sp. TaxID=1871047 RepID=UPI0012A791FD|nr:patatin-like phospholipase family protein [Chryseobacterium sp.]QFG52967.1 patatin [Chryseobacterium sp.]
MKTDQLNQLLQDNTLNRESRAMLTAMHERLSAKEYSDILDAQGNQYINFVQEGGGVWGTALVGYLYALETFGIRFLRIAGTSAGAINTILIAALGDRSRNKSSAIKDVLFNWNFVDFMDGKSIVRTMAGILLKNPKLLKRSVYLLVLLLLIIIFFPVVTLFRPFSIWFYLVPLTILVIVALGVRYYYDLFRKNRVGLNPGHAFERKLKQTLDHFGIKTVEELNAVYNKKGAELNLNYRFGNTSEYYFNALNHVEEIHAEKAASIDENRYRTFLETMKNTELYKNNPFMLLRSDYTVITTDINSRIKVEFPKMADLYWTHKDICDISPAKFVRASMAVPYFFEPMVHRINRSEPEIISAWKFRLNADPKGVFDEAVFIDGGSISNFPIDIFHESDIFYPRIPVFGVRLTDSSEAGAENGLGSKEILKGPGSYLMNIFDTLRGYNDKTFLTKYTFYSKHSIQTVDCSPSSWLNFFMKDAEKTELFNKGFRAGLEFLDRFDWEKYKTERMLVALKERKILKDENEPTVG